MNTFKYTNEFILESGFVFPEIEIAYSTYGTLNADRSNVVWICHALTANSDAADWWNGVVGSNHVIDPANILLFAPIFWVRVMEARGR
ncbi:MAG: hypothetical protein WDM90_02455 [Ferruginibacter sp.]